MLLGGISLSIIITFFLPLSNAQLMWRPHSLHYDIIQKTEPTKAEKKLVSTSKKYKASKSDRTIVPTTPSDSSWLSEQQDQPKSTTIMPKLMKIVPKTKLPKSKLPKSKSKQMKKSTKKPQRQYNPLCFFSALPCTSRRKDVYYRPRRGHKRSVRRHTAGSKFE
uniref:Uncharacterized protein n=1 Tax=Acrobeloides nanus TaxID=290746 RepID=A0A914EM07_9BILA